MGVLDWAAVGFRGRFPDKFLELLNAVGSIILGCRKDGANWSGEVKAVGDWKIGICGICPSGCCVEVLVRNGVLERVRPAKGHPLGTVCPRGIASPDVVYSPDRLASPLVRAGERGEGKFRKATWEEALDIVARRMLDLRRRYGAFSVAEYSGRGGGFEQSVMDFLGIRGAPFSAAKGFIFAFGSPNASSCTSTCYASHAILGPLSVWGVPLGRTYPDLDRSDLIVVWGANPATDSPPRLYRRILRRLKEGARLVAIDPRKTETASRGEWVPVRPGTDGALALGMINVLLRSGLYDQEFVRDWTFGFEELAGYAADFTPERVEAISGVPAARVEKLALSISRTPGVSLVMNTGLEYTNSGVQNVRAVLSLWSIAGKLDAPGCIVVRSSEKLGLNRNAWEPPEEPKPVGWERYPYFCDTVRIAHFMEFPEAILEGRPYPLKGLIIDGGSVLTSYPNPGLWRRAFSSLELLVVIDRFMTGDAYYADVVLPASTYYETSSYKVTGNFIQIRHPLIESVGESRGDYWIYWQLSKRLGLGEGLPHPDEVWQKAFEGSRVELDELLSCPAGLSVDAAPVTYRKFERGLLRKDGKPGFPTPTGKVELRSTLLEKYGYEGLPVYREPAEGPIEAPEVAEELPLILTTGARLGFAFRSQGFNVPRLCAIQPVPKVWIHPRDAELRGIADGDPVFLVTGRGRAPFVAKVTECIRPGTVEANSSGGSPIHPEPWRQANVNELIDDRNRDPISGFPVLKALLCDVVPKTGAPARAKVDGL